MPDKIGSPASHPGREEPSGFIGEVYDAGAGLGRKSLSETNVSGLDDSSSGSRSRLSIPENRLRFRCFRLKTRIAE
jgi:hypothetical protein